MLALRMFSVSVLISLVTPQNVPWSVTCVTDEFGYPRVAFDNKGDEPISYKMICLRGSVLVFVDPHTITSVPVFFPWQDESDSLSACALRETNTRQYNVGVVFSVVGSNFLGANFTYCSRFPGVEDRVQAYTDCRPGSGGQIPLNVRNNLDVPLLVSLKCHFLQWNDDRTDYRWLQIHAVYTIPVRSYISFALEIFRGYDEDYTSCFFIPADPYMYATVQLLDRETLSFSYTANIWCTSRSDGLEEKPEVDVTVTCPNVVSGTPTVELRGTVPSYAEAFCLNGRERLSTQTIQSAKLFGTFGSEKSSDCQFHRRENSNTYFLPLEAGYGDPEQGLVVDVGRRTLTCVYDDVVSAASPVKLTGSSSIAPEEMVVYLGDYSLGVFEMRILDMFDHEIYSGEIYGGRYIRLKIQEVSDIVHGFHAHRCIAHNGVTSYAILRNGCGDGLILAQGQGFISDSSDGKVVYSPFFPAFRLRGGRNIWFECRFSVCPKGRCDGSSCPHEVVDDPVHNIPVSHAVIG